MVNYIGHAQVITVKLEIFHKILGGRTMKGEVKEQHFCDDSSGSSPLIKY